MKGILLLNVRTMNEMTEILIDLLKKTNTNLHFRISKKNNKKEPQW